MKYEFPQDFIWGVATAAAQIEGAAFEDGRGPSIWDVFSRIPGKIAGATMYHWDLPYALQVQGGFGNRDIVKWFKNYVNVLLDNFGEDVDIWATLNEPIATYVGYAKGFFAPGLTNEKYARQALHHLLLCHGEAVKLFRERRLPNAKIGIVVDVWKHFPGRPGNAEDEALAKKNNEIEGYGMFLHPLFLGEYSKELLQYFEENGLMPKMEDGDLKTICQKLDFYGLNFYNGLYDNAEELRRREEEEAKGGNYQNRPENHTEVLGDVLRMLVGKYKIDIPIYITENGVAQDDSEDVEAMLDDQERIDYIKGVLISLHRAMKEGIDVRGYYAWSLMDNFEWSAGFQARFGLHYTDYKTLKRIPKKSAGWYAQVIANNGFCD